VTGIRWAVLATALAAALAGCASSQGVSARFAGCETLEIETYKTRGDSPTKDCPTCFTLPTVTEAKMRFQVITSNTSDRPQVITVEVPGYGSKNIEAAPGETLHDWDVSAVEAPGNQGCQAIGTPTLTYTSTETN